MLVSDDLRRFAEEPEAEISEPVAPEGRILRPSFCVVLSASPTLSTVIGVRTTEAGLDDTIAEVRAALKEKGYSRAVWRVGPSSRPAGLLALLKARGFGPATRAPIEPGLHAMVLAQAPPDVPPNVEARLVRNLEEYRQALDIAMEAFELTPEDAADWRAAAPKLWEQQDGVDRMTLIAYVDGQPAGFAWAASGPTALVLCGSGVLAAKRGRGAYRALLAARWKRAVELGKPALVIHAGEMSRPIVARCGFQEVCKIDLLDDPHFG
jgi:hypothetical protein